MAIEDKIAKLAYKFYLKREGKNGSALDDWLKAERIILSQNRFINGFFKFIRHPLSVIIISGILSSIFIWPFQQRYIKNEEMSKRKFEVMKMISPICASYYQETWNQWYAFQNKTPSEKYRGNIQGIVAEAKSIETQLPILFKDKKIYEDWQKILHIFWQANYPISREGISEQQLNEKLNSVNPLLDDILNRMYKELK